MPKHVWHSALQGAGVLLLARAGTKQKALHEARFELPDWPTSVNLKVQVSLTRVAIPVKKGISGRIHVFGRKFTKSGKILHKFYKIRGG